MSVPTPAPVSPAIFASAPTSPFLIPAPTPAASPSVVSAPTPASSLFLAIPLLRPFSLFHHRSFAGRQRL